METIQEKQKLTNYELYYRSLCKTHAKWINKITD